MIEVAFLFCDLGDAGPYAAMTKLAADSARKVMPDARLVQLTDRDTPVYPEMDASLRANIKAERATFAAFKGLTMAERGKTTDLPTALCDVDLIFNRSIEPVFDADFDVAVLWRPWKAQPYNGGMVYTKPTEGARRFWADYAQAVQEMPDEVKGWWGDQLALAVMIGQATPGDTVSVCGAKVLVLDMNEHAYAPEGPDDRTDAYTTHYKGPRKQWMLS